MTLKEKKNKIKPITAINSLTAIALTSVVFMTAVYLSNDIGEYVQDALNLSIRIIIPSVFPFLLLSDIIVPYISFDSFPRLSRLFERLFGINGRAMPAAICGMLCGFPIGAKMAMEYERCGIISNDECQRLAAFASNAGAGFVISAVGAALRGNIYEGVILYFSMILSAIICGIITKQKEYKKSELDNIIKQKYDFVHSVKSSAIVCLNVSAFICTFGIIIGLIENAIKNRVIIALCASLLEIGNAAELLAGCTALSPPISLSLTSFAISFSGLSVIFQTIAIQSDKRKINAGLYIKRKLLQGIISSLITCFISCITIFFS